LEFSIEHPGIVLEPYHTIALNIEVIGDKKWHIKKQAAVQKMDATAPDNGAV
jgi:hypothetical protein